MGRDLDEPPPDLRRDRPEPLALGPERLGDRPHRCLHLRWWGIGGEVEVDLVQGCPAVQVAHQPAHEVEATPRRGKGVDQRSALSEDRLGTGGQFVRGPVGHRRPCSPTTASTTRPKALVPTDPVLGGSGWDGSPRSADMVASADRSRAPRS